MTKGILIIATLSPLYGRMAYNLALTIKATGTQIPVAIVHDKASVSHLSDEQKKMFDVMIETDKNWNQIRFNIDLLSPFDLTFQMDADMLWLWRDPAELFEKYGDVELLVTNEGYFDIETKTEHITNNYPWLADRDKTIELYKLKGKLYLMRWEALFFKKTKKVRSMFERSEKIREKPKLTTWLFEGEVVDEFCFYVAANQCGLDQKESPFLPAYWCKATFNPHVAEISKNYFAIGFGGNAAPSGYKKIYDIIMQRACYKLGLRYCFKLQSKKEYVQTRKNIS